MIITNRWFYDTILLDDILLNLFEHEEDYFNFLRKVNNITQFDDSLMYISNGIQQLFAISSDRLRRKVKSCYPTVLHGDDAQMFALIMGRAVYNSEKILAQHISGPKIVYLSNKIVDINSYIIGQREISEIKKQQNRLRRQFRCTRSTSSTAETVDNLQGSTQHDSVADLNNYILMQNDFYNREDKSEQDQKKNNSFKKVDTTDGVTQNVPNEYDLSRMENEMLFQKTNMIKLIDKLAYYSYGCSWNEMLTRIAHHSQSNVTFLIIDHADYITDNVECFKGFFESVANSFIPTLLVKHKKLRPRRCYAYPRIYIPTLSLKDLKLCLKSSSVGAFCVKCNYSAIQDSMNKINHSSNYQIFLETLKKSNLTIPCRDSILQQLLEMLQLVFTLEVTEDEFCYYLLIITNGKRRVVQYACQKLLFRLIRHLDRQLLESYIQNENIDNVQTLLNLKKRTLLFNEKQSAEHADKKKLTWLRLISYAFSNEHFPCKIFSNLLENNSDIEVLRSVDPDYFAYIEKANLMINLNEVNYHMIKPLDYYENYKVIDRALSWDHENSPYFAYRKVINGIYTVSDKESNIDFCTHFNRYELIEPPVNVIQSICCKDLSLFVIYIYDNFINSITWNHSAIVNHDVNLKVFLKDSVLHTLSNLICLNNSYERSLDVYRAVLISLAYAAVSEKKFIVLFYIFSLLLKSDEIDFLTTWLEKKVIKKSPMRKNEILIANSKLSVTHNKHDQCISYENVLEIASFGVYRIHYFNEKKDLEICPLCVKFDYILNKKDKSVLIKTPTDLYKINVLDCHELILSSQDKYLIITI